MISLTMRRAFRRGEQRFVVLCAKLRIPALAVTCKLSFAMRRWPLRTIESEEE